MFDNINDAFAKLSIHRLQKRIDALNAQQESLKKFTTQRTLNELEHYRLGALIGIAQFVWFGFLVLILLGFAILAKISHFSLFIKVEMALIILMLVILFVGLWDSTVFRTFKYWNAASPINRASLQRRIDDLQQTLTKRMAKRFGLPHNV